MSTHQPQALLFDLGGVLIDIDFSRALRAWQPFSLLSLDELTHAFKFDHQYEQHERGEISAAEYFHHLSVILKMTDDINIIATGWNAIFVSEIIETRSMIQTARSQFPCYAFTNTNPTHRATWETLFPMVAASFDKVITSYEMGCRKPEKKSFEHAAKEIGVPLDSILFFDDLLENIEGAAAVGLQTVYVRSPEDVRAALKLIGCTC